MKYMIFSTLLAAGFFALSSMDAGAVVCARGVVRAGCVAAGGGTVVVAPVVVRPVVVAPRPVVRRRVY